jgi:microcystin degradation protein MlrC
MRVALAGFLHETNTFAPNPADLQAFQQGGGYIPLTEGAALLEAGKGVNLGISGALTVAAERGWQVEPVLWAGAIPSAHVTEEAFESIAKRIVEGIRAAGPLDGVFLDLHGAMVTTHLDDGEGELATRVRAVVGPDVPIAAALDLHGNISRRLVEMVDVLTGFRTYPHVDMAETGARAARLLDDILRSGTLPAKAYRSLPYMVPISFQSTTMEPAASLYRSVAQMDDAGTAASLFMGFPAADIPDCGPCAIAFAPTQKAADAAVDQIAAAYGEAESAFDSRTYTAAEGVAEAQRLLDAGVKGPIVLADTQDNPGAGGAATTTGMLRALVEAEAQNAALGLIVDPESVSRAFAAGEGASVALSLGGHPDFPEDVPFEAEAVVERLVTDKLQATGPYYGGTWLDLSPAACLRIGDVRVVVTSQIAQLADREMFRFVGITPEDQSILVLKSSTHFRADFDPIAGKTLVCLAPGPMAFSPADLPFTRLRTGLRLSPNGPVFGS